MNKKIAKATDFDEYLAEELKRPKFKKWYDYWGEQLDLSYKISELRLDKEMSQADLAKKLKTKQSNVARMESGDQNFTVAMLRKIAKALDRKLRIDFIK